MKTNDYLLVAATAAYSYLFYQQTAGINFLLFNIVLIILLAIKNRQVLASGKWWWAAAMCLASSVAVFVHSSALSVISNICSLLLLSAFSANAATSSIFSFLFGIYSVLSSMVFVIIDAVLRSQKTPPTDERKGRGHRVLAVLIALVLGILFFVMYQQSNPLFAENTRWINFDFISFYWVVFTLGGFLVVYGLLYHKSIPEVESWENKLPVQNDAYRPEGVPLKRYETVRFAGVLLFSLLNLMLVLLNMGDIQTLYFKGGLPKGVSHSDFVHNGVGVIILSIVVATGLIMFLFRKDYEAVKQSAPLKWLVYLWILQNLLMLSSTWLRNGIYIHDYNYTYRRIGVYVWLVLAAAGLVIAFIKIKNERSNWFLIKYNFALWFTVLAASSLINWDLLITRHNIANKPLRDVDFYYLMSLSASNIPELLAVTKDNHFRELNSSLRDYNSAYNRFYNETYTGLLTQKIRYYVSNRSGSWKSRDLCDDRIMKSLHP